MQKTRGACLDVNFGNVHGQTVLLIDHLRRMRKKYKYLHVCLLFKIFHNAGLKYSISHCLCPIFGTCFDITNSAKLLNELTSFWLPPLYLCSVSTDGNLYGRLPSLPAEHLWCHPLPAVDLGCGNCRGAAGPLHCLCMLLLCKCLPTPMSHKERMLEQWTLTICTKGTLSLCRQCWRQYQWVPSPQTELCQVVLFPLLPLYCLAH